MKSQEIAFLSVDNLEGFENASLNNGEWELYVKEGELAAIGTKQCIEICKQHGISIYEIFDKHPRGHILFVANYKNKKPFDTITYEEVSLRTEEDNRIGERAAFTLKELQAFLKEVGQATLRRDHCIEGTQWVELMPPLEPSDFSIRIPKGTAPVSSGYSGFEKTNLDQILQEQGKKTLLMGGVATDYCVGQTALDGVDLGYEVYLVAEAIRGVAPETTQATIQEMTSKWVKLITIAELAELLSKNLNQ